MVRIAHPCTRHSPELCLKYSPPILYVQNIVTCKGVFPLIQCNALVLVKIKKHDALTSILWKWCYWNHMQRAY